MYYIDVEKIYSGGIEMEYDRIILEMLDRIKALEDEVATLKSSAPVVETKPLTKPIKPGKKYRHLAELLENSKEKKMSLTFSQIENAIGFSLPESARQYREFWANTTTHSIALSWLSVGYKTVDVNLANETVIFERYKYGI